jgi:hypothetical protein
MVESQTETFATDEHRPGLQEEPQLTQLDQQWDPARAVEDERERRERLSEQVLPPDEDPLSGVPYAGPKDVDSTSDISSSSSAAGLVDAGSGMEVDSEVSSRLKSI